jgi:lysophospholipase L1-like esterase
LRWALFAASLGVSLIAAELIHRRLQQRVEPVGPSSLGSVQSDPGLLIASTDRGKRLVPGTKAVIRNHRLSRRDIQVEINSHGFRDIELAVPRPVDELRILAIGDSITWGDYLQADEVWVERAERKLGQALPARSVQIVNGGVGDMGLAEEIDLLEERGLALEPQLVLLAFYLNDSRPPWGFPAELGSPGWLRRHSSIVDAVYRAARLRGWVEEHGVDRFAEWVPMVSQGRWRTEPAAFEAMVGAARFDWGAAWDPDSWQSVERELDRLEGLARAHRFELAMVAFPVRFQVDAEFLDDTPQRALGEIAARRGIPLLDLLQPLRDYPGGPLYYDQCHPTVLGNAVVGAEVASFLAALLDSRAAVAPGSGAPAAGM